MDSGLDSHLVPVRAQTTSSRCRPDEPSQRLWTEHGWSLPFGYVAAIVGTVLLASAVLG